MVSVILRRLLPIAGRAGHEAGGASRGAFQERTTIDGVAAGLSHVPPPSARSA
jgi:hypothetical protein